MRSSGPRASPAQLGGRRWQAARAAYTAHVTPETLARLQREAHTSDAARLVLADAWEHGGRSDVAMLWRDELPARAGVRSRVDELSDAERAALAPAAEQWTRAACSTEAADRPRFEAAVSACYRLAGLGPPVIAWCPSPLVAAIAGPLTTWLLAGDARRDALAGHRRVEPSSEAREREYLEELVREHGSDAPAAAATAGIDEDHLRLLLRHHRLERTDRAEAWRQLDAIRGSIDPRVDALLAEALDHPISPRSWQAVAAAIQDVQRALPAAAARYDDDDEALPRLQAQLDDVVGSSLAKVTSEPVAELLRAELAAPVYRHNTLTIGRLIDNRVRETIGIAGASAAPCRVWLERGWRHRRAGPYETGAWGPGGIAYAAFVLDVLGLELGREAELRARALGATATAACWWWPGRRFVIACERPSILDEQRAYARWEGWNLQPPWAQVGPAA